MTYIAYFQGYFNFDIMTSSQLTSVINDFNPIGLEQMDSVQLMNRVDTKFVFAEKDLPSILKSLSPYYSILEVENERISSYRSTYFDDTNYNFYIDHHRGKINRYKVRLRKYIASDLSFLEVKHKASGRTNKNRVRIKDLSLHLEDNQRQFLEEMNVDHEHLSVALSNNFDRITLVGKDIDERLTIDLNLSFDKEDKHVQMKNVVIAELKQDRINRNSPFYRLMKKRHIRPERISKYCIGLIKILGQENIKYNRFKEKLLQLNKLANDAA